MIDEYRVFLFKKKIRSAIPELESIRFGKSINGSHLIFDPGRYLDREEVADLVKRRLTLNHIEYKVKNNPFGLYSDLPESERPIWYISIPIDQDALPERRNQGRMSQRSYHEAET